MGKKKIAIIGGGAAGIVAAITASGNGDEIVIFERNERIGKKILATGNGKCNLGNLQMTEKDFHSGDVRKLQSCLERFGVQDTITFFENLGLMIREKNGYLYPLCEQAAVVLDVLRIAAQQKSVSVRTQTKVNAVKKYGRQFEVIWENGRELFDKVILTCGSKAAPKTGSDGNGYDLAKAFGHSVVDVVPSLVQLKCSDSFCKALAGIRAEGRVHIYENGRKLCTETGEVQLTEYGISGIPVFQLSAVVNRRLLDKKHGQITAKIDFLPGWTKEEWEHFWQERMKTCRQEASGSRNMVCESTLTVEEFFTGMLNKKLMMVFIKLAGLNPGEKVSTLTEEKLKKVFMYCKGLEYHITGHNGFENAQVCSGGVDLHEVTDNLESRIVPGLFFAGELLDVDGRCGGYNLQWAWTSGVIAGKGVLHD